MFFASDNSGPVHPKVMAALASANEDYVMSYGSDTLTETVQSQIREIFEAPDAAVYLVATGTAANSLILSTLTQPWDTVFCTPVSHINVDECNAPEFFTGGAKLTTVPETGGKMSPDDLRQTINTAEVRGVHGAQRGPVSITQVTEFGTVYSLEELQALCDVAKEFDLPVHLDGSRFTNALVALDCTPAEMTWKAGVDAVSFGGTKNGLMGVEAVIFFDPKHAWEFELRRKRGAHLFSKYRYLSAQMNAYLTDDLWLELAHQANQATSRLLDGLRQVPGLDLLFEPGANMIYAGLKRSVHQHLLDAGAVYHIEIGELSGDDPDEVIYGRFVCDWSASDENIDRFLNLVKTTTDG